MSACCMEKDWIRLKPEHGGNSGIPKRRHGGSLNRDSNKWCGMDKSRVTWEACWSTARIWVLMDVELSERVWLEGPRVVECGCWGGCWCHSPWVDSRAEQIWVRGELLQTEGEICLYFIGKLTDQDQFWSGSKIVKEAELGRRLTQCS